MSARRKAAKGVRLQVGCKTPVYSSFLGWRGTAGDDLLEKLSTLTNGLEVPKMFQRKIFHVSLVFLTSFDGTYLSPHCHSREPNTPTVLAKHRIQFERGGTPPLSGSPPSLLCRSACSPFCEPGLDQVPDQTPIALCEREFICKASFHKYANTVVTR